MYIPELIIPGTDLSDYDWARAVESQLHASETGLDETAVALDLFEQAQAHSDQRVNAESHRREMDRQAAIRAKYESDDRNTAASLLAEARVQAEMEARFSADVATKREDWAAGNLPKEYHGAVRL